MSFLAHIQHEFWSITEGREVLSPEEAKNPQADRRSPIYSSSDSESRYILRSSLASDGDDSKAKLALRKEKKWEGSDYW